MFRVVEGRVTPIPSVFGQKVLGRDGKWESVHDKALEFQKRDNFKRMERGLNPKGYNATVRFRYDENFAAKHGKDAVNTIRNVFTKVMSIYKWPSLPVPITLTLHPSIDPVKGKFTAEYDLGNAAAFSTDDVNINVMFAFDNNKPGITGIAVIGSVCAEAMRRTALCEYFNDDSASSIVVAHEIGHTFNMRHDFTDAANNKRYDSNGNACTSKILSYLKIGL